MHHCKHTTSRQCCRSCCNPAAGIAFRQFRRTPSGLIGGALVAAFVVLAAAAPWVAPYDPIAADFGNVLAPPSWGHAFGTDDIGRDILSRVVHGSRISLEAGLFTVAVALAVGLPLGLAAGFLGGRVDDLIMRAIEVILSFPTLVLALGMMGILARAQRRIDAARSESLLIVAVYVGMAWVLVE